MLKKSNRRFNDINVYRLYEEKAFEADELRKLRSEFSRAKRASNFRKGRKMRALASEVK